MHTVFSFNESTRLDGVDNPVLKSSFKHNNDEQSSQLGFDRFFPQIIDQRPCYWNWNRINLHTKFRHWKRAVHRLGCHILRNAEKGCNYHLRMLFHNADDQPWGVPTIHKNHLMTKLETSWFIYVEAGDRGGQVHITTFTFHAIR